MTRTTPRRAGRARATARALLVSTVLVSMAAGPAPAQEPGPEIRFGVRPANPQPGEPRTVAWLIHDARPGEVVRDAVVVENVGTLPVDLELYPADAVTTEEAQLSLLPGEAPREDVAGWISLGRERVSLEPGEEQRVPVTLRVPENATPGDHAGGVVARTIEPVITGEVETLLAVGARVYLRVPGDLVFDLRVGDVLAEVSGGRVAFLVPLENAGNTLLDVEAAYGLRGIFGLGATEEGARPVATLVPGARATARIEHPATLFGGPYTTSVDLSHEGGVEAAEISFFVFPPWPVLLALALVLALLVTLAVREIRRRRRRRVTA